MSSAAAGAGDEVLRRHSASSLTSQCCAADPSVRTGQLVDRSTSSAIGDGAALPQGPEPLLMDRVVVPVPRVPWVSWGHPAEADQSSASSFDELHIDDDDVGKTDEEDGAPGWARPRASRGHAAEPS